jgi:hypothetical protein
VLIPVTGADLNARLLIVYRIQQLQSGLNLLGVGLVLIGMTLVGSGKKEDWEK